MNRLRLRPYILLLLALFSLLSIPSNLSEKLRAVAISAFSPTWRGLESIRIAAFTIAPKKQSVSSDVEALELQCTALRQQQEMFRELLLSQQFIEEERSRFRELIRLGGVSGDRQQEDYFQKRSHYLGDVLLKRMQAIPARVIFREPALWGSTLWLGVGARDNDALGREIVAKNSPVVVGTTVVGVVEEVMQRKCRVRLITDSSLTPSVRAVRGSEQDRLLACQIDQLVQTLSRRSDLEFPDNLLHTLSEMKEELGSGSPYSLYLAKGELHGSSAPLFRGLCRRLKGVGFNYDFSDEEGDSRELRTGAGMGGSVPLLKVGDLLVTTGMDGIFPPDLLVGQITAISSLKEGGCSYGLEARSTAPNLEELRDLFVLPPQ
ncbi:MAG: hypothetical protein K940chlam2_00835 [Chlamydiae bacterium]|nr:hypothetical protein [Chlamydiota bacterium]